MPKDVNIRWNWLKGMYIFTIVGAGGFGLGIIIIPDLMRTIFSWPVYDPIIYGITGSVWLAFGVISFLGLHSPLKFVPILVLQLCYKSIWFIGVIFPLLITGKFPTYAVLHAVFMAAYIIGDLIAIPFSYVFAKDSVPGTELDF